MLAELLPAAVSLAELSGDLPGALLYPAEEVWVAGAIGARRREFATGRHCARVALRRLGVAPTAIGTLAGGGPAWPQGIVGSITHCAGYRAAAVGRAWEFASLGVDAEPAAPLPVGVLELISSPRERDEISVLGRVRPDVPWDGMLFSAEESVYKAWWPITQTFLDFTDADVTFGPRDATFVARVPAGDPTSSAPARFRGRFAVGGGLIVTAVTVAVETAV